MLNIDFGSGYNPYKNYKTCDITKAPFLDYYYDKETNVIFDLKPKSVDIFRLKNVIHHCNVEKLTKCLIKYLKPTGKIIIIEPLPENYESNICLDIFWYRYIYPRYEYSIPSINRIDYIKIFKSNNFVITNHSRDEIYDYYELMMSK